MWTMVSRTSAALPGAAGLALLFAPDFVLGMSAPDLPESGARIAQLLTAAFLGMGALDGLHRASVLGGIYGRPVVLASTQTSRLTPGSIDRTGTRPVQIMGQLK